MNALDILAEATEGDDLFESITALRDNLASIGGIGAFGHNLVKSQAYYNYGPYMVKPLTTT